MGTPGSGQGENDVHGIEGLEEQLVWLQTPFGDDANTRLHDDAVSWLRQRPGVAYPRLLELVRDRTATNLGAVIEILPLFGRDDAVPLIEDVLLTGSEAITWTAAQALAGIRELAALTALRAASESPRPEVATAAIDALATRGDMAACDTLRSLANSELKTVRLHAAAAAKRLGCGDE